jgi:hypothetical protein
MDYEMDFNYMIFTVNITHCVRDKQQTATHIKVTVQFSVFQVIMKCSRVKKTLPSGFSLIHFQSEICVS